MPADLIARLQKGPVLCDGAMGTLIYGKGVFINRCYDELNLSQPDLIRSIHHEYLQAGAEIIGINNRNLTTFDVDLAVTEKICREVPDEMALVSESGIKTPEDVRRIKACGVDAILVGEALMRGQLSIEQIRAV